jgi:hypothetical protein
VLAQAHGVLGEDRRSAIHGAREHFHQPMDGGGVQTPGRRHVDDLTVDQLDTSVRREDADFRHAQATCQSPARGMHAHGAGR